MLRGVRDDIAAREGNVNESQLYTPCVLSPQSPLDEISRGPTPLTFSNGFEKEARRGRKEYAIEILPGRRFVCASFIAQW